MALDSKQLARLRRDLGGENGFGDEAHFTDADLDENAEYVGGEQYHEAIVGLCLRQLYARYSLEIDVGAAGATARNSQILGHINRLYMIYQESLEERLGHYDQVALAEIGKARHPDDLIIPLDEQTARYRGGPWSRRSLSLRGGGIYP